jgi:hypothetical protein
VGDFCAFEVFVAEQKTMSVPLLPFSRINFLPFPWVEAPRSTAGITLPIQSIWKSFQYPYHYSQVAGKNHRFQIRKSKEAASTRAKTGSHAQMLSIAPLAPTQCEKSMPQEQELVRGRGGRRPIWLFCDALSQIYCLVRFLDDGFGHDRADRTVTFSG